MVAPLPAHRGALRAMRAVPPPAAESINDHRDAGQFDFFLHSRTYLFCLAAMPAAPVMHSRLNRGRKGFHETDTRMSVARKTGLCFSRPVSIPRDA